MQLSKSLTSALRKTDVNLILLNSHVRLGMIDLSRKAARIERIIHGEQPVDKKATVFYPPH